MRWALVCDGQVKRQVDLAQPVDQCDGTKRKVRPEIQTAASQGDAEALAWLLDKDIYEVVEADAGVQPPNTRIVVSYDVSSDKVVQSISYVPLSQEEQDSNAEAEEREGAYWRMPDHVDDMDQIIDSPQSSGLEKALASAMKDMIYASGYPINAPS